MRWRLATVVLAVSLPSVAQASFVVSPEPPDDGWEGLRVGDLRLRPGFLAGFTVDSNHERTAILPEPTVGFRLQPSLQAIVEVDHLLFEGSAWYRLDVAGRTDPPDAPPRVRVWDRFGARVAWTVEDDVGRLEASARAFHGPRSDDARDHVCAPPGSIGRRTRAGIDREFTDHRVLGGCAPLAVELGREGPVRGRWRLGWRGTRWSHLEIPEIGMVRHDLAMGAGFAIAPVSAVELGGEIVAGPTIHRVLWDGPAGPVSLWVDWQVQGAFVARLRPLATLEVRAHVGYSVAARLPDWPVTDGPAGIVAGLSAAGRPAPGQRVRFAFLRDSTPEDVETSARFEWRGTIHDRVEPHVEVDVAVLQWRSFSELVRVLPRIHVATGADFVLHQGVALVVDWSFTMVSDAVPDRGEYIDNRLLVGVRLGAAPRELTPRRPPWRGPR